MSTKAENGFRAEREQQRRIQRARRAEARRLLGQTIELRADGKTLGTYSKQKMFRIVDAARNADPSIKFTGYVDGRLTYDFKQGSEIQPVPFEPGETSDGVDVRSVNFNCGILFALAQAEKEGCDARYLARVLMSAGINKAEADALPVDRLDRAALDRIFEEMLIEEGGE